MTSKLVASIQLNGSPSGDGFSSRRNLRTFALLLAHRRQGVDGGELHPQPGRLVLINRDAMTFRPRRRRKLGKDAMSGIAWGGVGSPLRQPVRLHAHEEAGTKVLRGALELVGVALPVTHMQAAVGRANERDGLAQVLQPAVALLVSIGTRMGLMCRLSASVPLNFVRVQNFAASDRGVSG
ncbi:hypothetical protein [Mesorhizobium sp. M1273]|uniref:hypothetical protein n=1 Tax=Mesorhizobium sp. M1273 TaxID=2957075 RepID=UPI003338336E